MEYHIPTEPVSIAVTFLFRIREAISSILGRNIDYPEVRRGFPQSLEANVVKQATTVSFQFHSNSFTKHPNTPHYAVWIPKTAVN
jgi:hypothetical protein